MKKKVFYPLVFAIILFVAAMFAMPAAARSIASGDTIFDYETDLDLSAIAADGDFLARYTDDDTTKGQINSIPIPNAANLDLTAIDLRGNYGTYYVVSDTTKRVYIREPTVELNAVLAYSLQDSISGKTVTPGTAIAFRFDAPEVGSYFPDAAVGIVITKPNGATITMLPSGDGTYQSLSYYVLNASRVYTGSLDISGLEEGNYSAQAVWKSPHGFDAYAADSNTVTFTIRSMDLGITANKESVVRNNPFVVTISGEPKSEYLLYVKDASTAPGSYPFIKPGQPGTVLMQTEFATAPDQGGANMVADRERAWGYDTYVPNTAARVYTRVDGTRSLEFGTNMTTDDQTFTVKVINPRDASEWDEVKVRIEKGTVTMTVEGTGFYYPGEKITLSGTNTDSDRVYLFMTGPNLDRNGAPLDDLSAKAANGSYLAVDVLADDTWTYRWDTGMYPSPLLPGTYTLYAAATNKDWNGAWVSRASLGGVEYSTHSVVVGDPSISVNISGNCASRGDEISLRGTATGSPTNVRLWVIGGSDLVQIVTLPVSGNGGFGHLFGRKMTAGMDAGTYYLIVQHPMIDGAYCVRPDPTNIPGQGFRIITATGATLNLSGMTAANAAFTVLEAMNAPESNDICTGANFLLEEPRIDISEIGDVHAGESIRIGGTTNLAVGDHLNVNVSSAQAGMGKTLEVLPGEGENIWSWEVNTSRFEPGGYEVQVSGVEVRASAQGSFIVLGAPTPTLLLKPSRSEAFLSSSAEYAVVLNTAPEGLSGYNVTVSLANTSIGEITAVSFPSWVSLSSNGTLPSDSTWITGIDLSDAVGAGMTNITLCTLTIRADAAGETGIILTPGKLDTDFGSRYQVDSEDGLLQVVSILPFQREGGGTYPPPTDPDHDGIFEDLDGNGWIGFNDVVLYFNQMSYIENNEPIGAFDYDRSGFIGFNDVVWLFGRI